MQPVIELELGQTAQPEKCGSCKFFGRRAGPGDLPSYIKGDTRVQLSGAGYCNLKLPPQYQIKGQGEGAPTNWINDTGSCDLWKWSGVVYVEKRVVKP